MKRAVDVMPVVCIPGYIYRHNRAVAVVDYTVISYALIQNALVVQFSFV